MDTCSHTCTDLCIAIYIYIYIYVERERERERQISLCCKPMLQVEWICLCVGKRCIQIECTETKRKNKTKDNKDGHHRIDEAKSINDMMQEHSLGPGPKKTCSWNQLYFKSIKRKQKRFVVPTNL